MSPIVFLLCLSIIIDLEILESFMMINENQSTKGKKEKEKIKEDVVLANTCQKKSNNKFLKSSCLKIELE